MVFPNQFDGQGYKTREELRHIMWRMIVTMFQGGFVKGIGINRLTMLMTVSGTAFGKMVTI